MFGTNILFDQTWVWIVVGNAKFYKKFKLWALFDYGVDDTWGFALYVVEGDVVHDYFAYHIRQKLIASTCPKQIIFEVKAVWKFILTDNMD